MQALCRAVEDALPKSFTIPADSLILWMRLKTVIDRLLTFRSHRDTHITYDTRALISTHLATNPTYLIEIRTFRKAWTGFPSKTDMKSMSTALDSVLTDYPQPSDLTPKQVMWRHISTDYSPSPRRSHIAYTPPVGNRPPPAICAAIRSHNRRLTSAIFQFATGHMFNADYSDRFHPNTLDNHICPCKLTPCNLPHQPPRRYLHTANHVLFQCINTLKTRERYLQGHASLVTILTSEHTTSLLCAFLKETKCSLLCPLPVRRPGWDPP
jgi:hypothetical protein